MNKSEFEKSVFLAFSEVAPFKVLPDTIENRMPPEPDILCEIDDRGLVGFELTELIDQSYMERTALTFSSKKNLDDYWKNKLSKEQSDLFFKKYGGTLLHFEFSRNSSLKERKSKMKIAFDLLLHLEGETEGIKFENNPNLMPIIEEVRVSHLGLDSPVFDVGCYCQLGDPTETAIKKKLGKKYSCDYPIELLVHIEMNLLPPEEVWIAAAERIALQIEGSPFRKIWVFDRSSNSVKCSYGV